MISPSESLMDELYEVRPGVHKRAVDCTARDLKSYGEVLKERSEQAAAIRALLDQVLAGAEAKGLSHVPLPACIVSAGPLCTTKDVPDGVRHGADLPMLRTRRAALEACVEEMLG